MRLPADKTIYIVFCHCNPNVIDAGSEVAEAFDNRDAAEAYGLGEHDKYGVGYTIYEARPLTIVQDIASQMG